MKYELNKNELREVGVRPIYNIAQGLKKGMNYIANHPKEGITYALIPLMMFATGCTASNRGARFATGYMTVKEARAANNPTPGRDLGRVERGVRDFGRHMRNKKNTLEGSIKSENNEEFMYTGGTALGVAAFAAAAGLVASEAAKGKTTKTLTPKTVKSGGPATNQGGAVFDGVTSGVQEFVINGVKYVIP